jgi:hypothetical protein
MLIGISASSGAGGMPCGGSTIVTSRAGRKTFWPGRRASVETTKGAIRARLVRFRNGAVFECRSSSRWGRGHTMTRIERRHFSDPIPMLVNCLVEAVLRLGLDAQPVE